MRGIDVSTDDDVLFVCFEVVSIAEELVVEIKFVLESFLVFLAIREVDIEQIERRIGGDEDASFIIELFSTKTVFYRQWFLFGEGRDTAVSFFFCGVPVEVVARDVSEVWWELFWCCFYLLEAQDVW